MGDLKTPFDKAVYPNTTDLSGDLATSRGSDPNADGGEGEAGLKSFWGGSDRDGDGAGVVNAANDIPYRQVIIQSSAAVTVGDSSAHAATGMPIGVNGSIVLGPFSTGPIKLSELWVVGAATVSILGIPY